MTGNPSRIKQITKHRDESNWRNQKWEKPIQEIESPSFAPKTEMSIKLEDDDEQNQRSRLKELITQRLEAQSIALSTKQENERDLRSQLKKGAIHNTKPLSITQAPFIEENETDEESETEEDYKRRREFIHAYLTMDNEKEKQEETETKGDTVETPKEQKRKLIHAYSKRMLDNDKEQTEQDEIDTYLRTSMEEEQKPSTWEEYEEEEPFEEYDEDKSFKENNEGKCMTQFSYPTEEEENALFIPFMTGNVEDQKNWINAKMDLARATTNEETRRREEEILNRIIFTEIMDLDKAFEEEDEEETDDSECRTHDLEDNFSPMNHGIYSLLF